MTIGVVCGYLGAAPSLLWAVSAITLVLAPILIVASVWLYTLVFAFSSLWFTHYGLAALQRLRMTGTTGPATGPVVVVDAAPPVPDLRSPPPPALPPSSPPSSSSPERLS